MSSIFQIFDGHQYVWDINTLAWVPMEQPILNAGSVTVSGTLNQGTGGSSAWKVDGSAVTQPVSGTVAVSGSVAVTGSFYPATQPVSLASAPTTPVTNANLDVALSTLATASAQTTGNSSLSTIATNTGLAATAAKQDTGNASLSSLDGKTPALGQALAASSTPVVLTAIQVAALTPPAAITGFALDSSLTTLNAKDFATSANQTTELASLATIAAVDFAVESDGNLETIATNTTDTQETTAETHVVLMACLRELKLLRQSFQDWSGSDSPRYDPEIRIH